MIKKQIAVGLCAIFFAGLASSAIAGNDYKQTITLKVTGTDAANVCFTTTDWFDGKFCGNNASNTFDHGPKKVKLVAKNTYKLVAADTNCKQYLDKVETPSRDGNFTITAKVFQEQSLIFLPSAETELKISNCTKSW